MVNAPSNEGVVFFIFRFLFIAPLDFEKPAEKGVIARAKKCARGNLLV